MVRVICGSTQNGHSPSTPFVCPPGCKQLYIYLSFNWGISAECEQSSRYFLDKTQKSDTRFWSAQNLRGRPSSDCPATHQHHSHALFPPTPHHLESKKKKKVYYLPTSHAANSACIKQQPFDGLLLHDGKTFLLLFMYFIFLSFFFFSK